MAIKSDSKSVENNRTISSESGASRCPDSAPGNALQVASSALLTANEGLQAFLRLSQQSAWEFDHDSRLLTFFGENAPKESFPKQLAADSLINSGIVHRDSLPVLRLFLENLLHGAKQGGTFLMLRLFGDAAYSWYSVSCQTLTDANNKPCRTVGTLSRVTDLGRGTLTFRQSIGAFSSENCVSLGVLVAAVADLLALVNKNGPDHCSAVLSFLREQLSHCFANSIVINTCEQEFVVLSPNVDKDSFLNAAAQLRQLCSCRHAGQIAFGTVWSKGKFTWAKLVQQARTKMLSQSEEPEKTTDIVKAPSILDVHIPISQFTVFYQPKVNMQNKCIIGAEALVRGMDARGNIQPPGNFISILEREGQLRTLDLFVLSRVLQQLAQWKRTGKRLIPVSVNFSRYTLFDPSTADTVLALLRNYDEVDPSLIEIEITKEVCSVEAETLNQAVKPYLDLGIHFALDDFGTGINDLALLSKIHFNTIKLDRTFIKNLKSSSAVRLLIDNVVKFGRESNSAVVVEGVDEYDLSVELSQMGCRFAQGYFYDQPLDVKTFTQKYLR